MRKAFYRIYPFLVLFAGFLVYGIKMSIESRKECDVGFGDPITHRLVDPCSEGINQGILENNIMIVVIIIIGIVGYTICYITRKKAKKSSAKTK